MFISYFVHALDVRLRNFMWFYYYNSSKMVLTTSQCLNERLSYYSYDAKVRLRRRRGPKITARGCDAEVALLCVAAAGVGARNKNANI